jgi:hypothetical protein
VSVVQKDLGEDQVVVRCGSHFVVASHSLLKRHGQGTCNPEPSDDGSDFLTTLSNTCKYLVDLKPAPESAKVAECIVRSFQGWGGDGRGSVNSWDWDRNKQCAELTDSELVQLLEAADRFALHPLLRSFLINEVRKPMWYKQKKPMDILQRFSHHHVVVQEIADALEDHIEKTVVEVGISR